MTTISNYTDMKKYCMLLMVVFLAACEQNDTPKYRNASLAIETRVDDLLSRMTLEEKAGQLDMYSGSDLTDKGKLSVEKTDKVLEKTTIGSIHDYYPDILP